MATHMRYLGRGDAAHATALREEIPRAEQTA
jgi:hypothetical protein